MNAAGATHMTHFDTLQYVKRAVAAGIDRKVAEFHAEEMAVIVNEQVVTKAHFDKEMILNRENITRQLLDLEVRLTWRLMGGMAFLLTASQVVGHFFK